MTRSLAQETKLEIHTQARALGLSMSLTGIGSGVALIGGWEKRLPGVSILVMSHPRTI